MNTLDGIDVLILAGGRGSRFDGRDKAQLTHDGERFIDRILDEVSLYSALLQVTVVTSRDLTVRPGVRVVAEDPPFSGPVAAIAAGMAAMRTTPAALTLILPVDAPFSGELINILPAALLEDAGADAACAVAVDATGRLQPLNAVWRTEALWERLAAIDAPDNRAVRELYDGIRVHSVPGDGLERDVDTAADLAALDE